MFTTNPFPETLIGESLVDISYLSYATKKGIVGTIRVGDGQQTPILRVGGPTDILESDASREVDSTMRKTTKQEGLITNPAVLFPSSFFAPIPPMIKGMLFSGPLSIIDNPLIIIALVLAASEGDDDKYTTHYKNTPTKVIDNQALEDKLFGSTT